MGKLRVKTTYKAEGAYASTEIETLYCFHNESCDCTTFYDSNGRVESMAFCEWDGDDLWDAMNRLWSPYKDEWGGELIDGVEYYHGEPWKENK